MGWDTGCLGHGGKWAAPSCTGAMRSGGSQSGVPFVRGPGIPGCAASWVYGGGDVPSSGVVVRAVVPGVVDVGVSDVRLDQLWEVSLVDRLGRAGVVRGDSVRLLIPQWLPRPGAPESWDRRARFPVLRLWMLKG